MLRLLLPPNLTASAPRDAIAVKVEIDSNQPPPPEWLPALALLQRWCGPAAKPPFLLQLSRAQLRELIAALLRQPVFFFANAPAQALLWVGPLLMGVSEHLREIAPRAEEPAKAPAPSRGPAKPTTASIRSGSTPPTPMVVDGTEHFLAITLPSREHPAYSAALELLKSHGFTLEPSNRKWWLRDRHKTLNFLAENRARLRDGLDAQFTDNFEKRTAHLRAADVAVTAVPSGDGFDVTLGLSAGTADEAAMRTAVAGNRGYVEADGQVYLLDRVQLSRLAAAQGAIAGEPKPGLSTRRTQRVSGARTAEVQELIEQLSPGFQPPDAWKERSAALRNLSALTPAPLEREFEGQLRPYQRLGAAWLWHLHRHRLGGILADEMGLGKTLQALALLSALRARLKVEGTKLKEPDSGTGARSFNVQPSPLNSTSVSLVVCPASLVENWRREAARFTPALRVFVHHGANRLANRADASACDLIVTSYGTLARDRELFAEIEFATVIADEAQHIKNRRSQNAAALRSLRATSRFLLTGTPLENALDDLRSLFEFLLPGYLTPVPATVRGEERAWFDERLRAQVAPYILRRTKQAVAPELPPKLEQVVWCELTPVQAALYRQFQENAERELLKLASTGAGENQIKFAALTQLLRLRQVCCDPRLVKPLAGETSSGSTAAAFEDSAKLDAFRELLAEAIDDGHRVLVFSQFTSMLALLCAELEAQQTPYCYLDGSMPPRARQAEVDRFQENADIPLFLISLKAGGTGLNLTGADTVIHFDPWWNPAAEAQATDRAHRIGQTKTVTSYKLIASGTVEEKVLALQDTKRALLADVFEASDAASARLTLADLKDLLA